MNVCYDIEIFYFNVMLMIVASKYFIVWKSCEKCKTGNKNYNNNDVPLLYIVCIKLYKANPKNLI